MEQKTTAEITFPEASQDPIVTTVDSSGRYRAIPAAAVLILLVAAALPSRHKRRKTLRHRKQYDRHGPVKHNSATVIQCEEASLGCDGDYNFLPGKRIDLRNIPGDPAVRLSSCQSQNDHLPASTSCSKAFN